jgi:hypothetical protein
MRRPSLFYHTLSEPLVFRLGAFLISHHFREENGFLLIETFRKTKLWPPGFDPWWLFTGMLKAI